MSKKLFFISLLVGTIAGGQIVLGADSSVNLARNPEFKLNAKGKAAPWSVRYGKIAEMITEGSEPGVPAVKMPLSFRKAARYNYGNVLSQQIKNPAPGTYIVTVNLAPSRKFNDALIVVYYTDPETGKRVFAPNGRLKIGDYPKPGEWKKKCYEVNIPENVKSLGFGVEVRDNKEDGFIKIEKPSFIFREE